MGKKAKEKSAIEVSRDCTSPGLHFVGGVAGLALQVMPSGSRSWILRVMVGGKRRDMGLGGYPDVTLAGAKEAARIARDKIKNGIDPIEDGRAARSLLAASRASALTFDQCADRCIRALQVGWKSAKHGAQWRTTLDTYASPVIGSLLVRDVEREHVLQVLEPIWATKTETASRVRQRIEAVLDWATPDYRTGDNPARWIALKNKLAKPSKVKTVIHHAALPWQEVGAFMADLRQHEGMGAHALEFAILTATRSGEVRGATWPEIDLQEGVWTIPAARMKAEKEHRVPLSSAARKLLRALPRFADSTQVFPNTKGGALSDMTLTAVLRRMGHGDITVHGFRSTFRDWAGETTAYPREVIEHALAHQLKDKAEAAYARGDLFTKRAKMMGDWAKHCTQPAIVGDVVPIKSKTVA